ncbi:hypothetical protein SuNHUV7_22300 (plasmid) [Pseudoseohaeicola sp. NH-UV-7]|uniref:hypothetical protein n=1 Tax=Sulfitobacter sp. TBRI5 TaxID=2989732 RepID=UPI003A723CDB
MDDLRRIVPEMDAAWYAGTSPIADALAGDVIITLTSMAREARNDISALGLDPDDRDGLRMHDHPAVHFYLECYEAIATFKYWADEGDFAAVLDRVELAQTKWLHGQPEPSEAVAQLSAAKARAATVQMAQRAQLSGLTRGNSERRAAAEARVAAVRDALGIDEAASLLSSIRRASDGPLAAVAALYGYGCVTTFLADLSDKSSCVRSQIMRDARRGGSPMCATPKGADRPEKL